MNQPISDRPFTEPKFSKYLELLFREDDFINLTEDTEYRATALSIFDKDCIHIYVEFPSKDNRLKHPRIWRIKAWKDSLEKYQKDKARAERERIEWCKFRENRLLLVKALDRLNGLGIEEGGINWVEMERIAKEKDVEAAKFFGVSLDL